VTIGERWRNGESGLRVSGLGGQPYVGQLRKEEILRIADRLITPTPPPTSHQYQPASFDLTVGAIITKEKEAIFWDHPDRHELVKLSPGEVALVLTREELHLPLDMVGNTLPVISKTLRGLLVLSHGHIDPGFEGALLVRILNIRKGDINLRISERILTVTFEQLPQRATRYEGPYNDYKALLEEAGQIVSDTAAGALLDVHGGGIDRLVDRKLRRWASPTLRSHSGSASRGSNPRPGANGPQIPMNSGSRCKAGSLCRSKRGRAESGGSKHKPWGYLNRGITDQRHT
jgi:deoxycytidine triphosphate deaminase